MRKEMKFVCSMGMFFGRVFLSLYFIWSGVSKLITFHDHLLEFSAHGIPVAKLFATLYILIQIFGGLSLFLGYRYKLAAFCLIVSRIFVIVYFYDFWNLESGGIELEKMYFLQNLAYIGGLLYVLSSGPGLCAYDKKVQKVAPVKNPKEPREAQEHAEIKNSEEMEELEARDSLENEEIIEPEVAVLEYDPEHKF